MTNLSSKQSVISFDQIEEASKNISTLLQETPLESIEAFNKLFNCDVYFKLENLQETGAFKVRGVINILCNLKKHNALPRKIATYGTGNHGLALAWAKRLFAIDEVKIYLPKIAADIKKELAVKYGAKIVITETRAEAELKAIEDADYTLIPPSDNDDIIAGAATVAYEAFNKLKDIDVIFLPIGGGSLASGTVLARGYMSPTTKIYAGEPTMANDAYTSYKAGNIFRFKDTPNSIADAATALGLAPRIFNYVKRLDGIYEVSEEEIAYWAVQFNNMSNRMCEPTSALAIASAYKWSRDQKHKKILIIITGGNISSDTQAKLNLMSVPDHELF